jgi:hypothetical protein
MDWTDLLIYGIGKRVEIGVCICCRFMCVDKIGIQTGRASSGGGGVHISLSFSGALSFLHSLSYLSNSILQRLSTYFYVKGNSKPVPMFSKKESLVTWIKKNLELSLTVHFSTCLWVKVRHHQMVFSSQSGAFYSLSQTLLGSKIISSVKL